MSATSSEFQMPNYRRYRVPGGTYFFTINLLERHTDLLTRHRFTCLLETDMTVAVTLRSKHQVVIPKEARDVLHLKPGKKLLVHVEGDMIIMVPEPDDYVKVLEGLHKDVWAGIDTDEYLRRERESWVDD